MLTSRNERQHYREQLSYGTHETGVMFDRYQCVKLEEIIRDADTAEVLYEHMLNVQRVRDAYRDEINRLSSSWWERLKRFAGYVPYWLAWRYRRLTGTETGW